GVRPQVPELVQGASSNMPSKDSPSMISSISCVKSINFVRTSALILALRKRLSRFRKILGLISETNSAIAGQRSNSSSDFPPAPAQASHHFAPATKLSPAKLS